MAYVSDQSGEDRVHVQRFPEGGRVIPVSAAGGTEPAWSHDGRELFYRVGNQMLAVAVEMEPEFRVGRPTVLFTADYDADPNTLGNPNYAVSPDATQFLMVTGGNRQNASLRFVLNWFEELKARVPVP